MGRSNARPNPNGRPGNHCAFCKYWNGDADVRRAGVFGGVSYELSASGSCNRTRATRSSGAPACNNFEMSYEVSRFC